MQEIVERRKNTNGTCFAATLSASLRLTHSIVVQTAGATKGFSPQPIFEEKEKGIGVLVSGKIPFWIILKQISDDNGVNEEVLDTCVKHFLSSEWEVYGNDRTTFYLPPDQHEHLLNGHGRLFRNFEVSWKWLLTLLRAETNLSLFGSNLPTEKI